MLASLARGGSAPRASRTPAHARQLLGTNNGCGCGSSAPPGASCEAVGACRSARRPMALGQQDHRRHRATPGPRTRLTSRNHSCDQERTHGPVELRPPGTAAGPPGLIGNWKLSRAQPQACNPRSRISSASSQIGIIASAYSLSAGDVGRAGSGEVPGARHDARKPTVHGADPLYVSAPWRYAAIAAGLLRRQSRFRLASNHTNPSSP